MARFDQTILVLDISPEVTTSDLSNFFSYCGTVDKILLERKEDQSQFAYVTFRQPYALQTALLLDDAVIGGHNIRILRLQISESLPVSYVANNETKKTEGEGLIPVVHSLVGAMSSMGSENLNKAKKVLDDLNQKSRVAAEQTVDCVGEVISKNEHLSAGALWLSAALDKAAKYAAELGTQNKKTDPKAGGQSTYPKLRDVVIN